MQTRAVLLFGVVVCVVFAILSEVSAGGGKGKWMEKMKKCGDGEIDVQEFFKGKEECKPEEKKEEEEEERRRRRSPGGGKKKKNWGGKWGDMCVAVCHMKKQGILDESGSFSESTCKEHVDKVYPEEYREDALTKIKECSTNHSSEFSMDNKCSGYKGFKKCLWGAHMKVCKIEMGGRGGKGGKGGNKQTPPQSANEDGGDEE